MGKKKTADTHDACVLKIAETLKKENWEVNANLEGWNKPRKVGAEVPDIEAKKEGCLTRICQVATPEMFQGDKKRYLELKNYSAEYDFHFYMIKGGKRVEINPADLSK